MSHVVNFEMEFDNLQVLAAAAEACGMKLVLDQKTWKWWGYSVGDYPVPKGWCCPQKIEKGKRIMGQADHAIQVVGNANAYEIGVFQKPNGKYGLIYDFYGGGHGLMEHISTDRKTPNILTEEYAFQRTVLLCQQQGWTVTRLDGGKLKIEIWDAATQTMGEVVVEASKIEANNFTGPTCATATNLISAALGCKTGELMKTEYYDVTQNLELGGY